MSVKPISIIGICGGSASGKTTLAKALCAQLGESNASTLSMDSYYKDRAGASTNEVNFDEPDSFDLSYLVADLHSLKAGDAIRVPHYDFTTHSRRTVAKVLEPVQYLLLDGLFIFNIPDLNELIDFRIFVDTPASERLMRRINRDTICRGRSVTSVTEQYLKTVAPMHINHVEPNKNMADIIINGDKPYNEVVSKLTHQITQL